MEKLIHIKLEKLPEGLYLATSDDVQGLVAQGRTVAETLEIARDIVRRLLEAHAERADEFHLSDIPDEINIPVAIGF
jgi:predicted RNase H-like HicB family nuclease